MGLERSGWIPEFRTEWLGSNPMRVPNWHNRIQMAQQF